MKFPLLYSPLQLGRLQIPNRMVVPALTTNFAEADGSVGDRLIGYLQARSLGGYGLVLTENIGVHPSGRVMPRMVMGSDDRYLPGLKRLAAAAKQGGSVAFAQLSHAGRQTKSRMTGMPIVAPSAVPCPLNREVPQALDLAGIHAMEQAFIDGARRVAEAGFDGIEIHGAHGYLVSGFLSRYSNKRSDEYGGSLENRMRFLLRIIAGVKRELGDEFPISVRISAREFVTDGLDIEESGQISQRLHEAGIHLLSVSVGVYESFNQLSMITGEPEGQWLDLAGALRRRVAPLPVIGVGRIKRPEVAEQALADGLLDLAAFGRASIADPYLPQKVRSGRLDEIISCFGCNICLGRSSRPETICPVNPAVGREFEFNLDRVAQPRRIRVVGASVAALTAAWVAAARGHQVTLDRAGQPMGGMQYWRSRVPGQEEYAEMVGSVERRALRAGVTYAADAPGPDTRIWRERRYQPVDLAWLSRHPGARSVYEALAGEAEALSGRAVIVIGSDLESAEAAIILARQGCTVRLYVAARDLADNAHPGYRVACKRLLHAYGATVVMDASGPDRHELDQADALVVGQPIDPAGHDDPECWHMAPAIASACGVGRADAYISDAYEPGIMTRGIYDAVDLAMGVG